MVRSATAAPVKEQRPPTWAVFASGGVKRLAFSFASAQPTLDLAAPPGDTLGADWDALGKFSLALQSPNGRIGKRHECLEFWAEY